MTPDLRLRLRLRSTPEPLPLRLSLTRSLPPLLLIAALLVALPLPVRAQLQVEHEPGAEVCADADALLARIEQLRGRPDAGASTGYRVVFVRADDGLVATIASGSDPARTRVLRDPGASATCAALEHATALSLALMLDSDARASTQRDVERDPARPAAPVTPPPPAAVARSVGTQSDADTARADSASSDRGDRPHARTAWRAQLALGVGAAFGVVRPLAPAFAVELGIAAGRVRGSLAGSFVPAQAHALGPGSVAETLWAASGRGCFAPWLGSSLRLDGCSGLYAGALHARAEGFTRNDDATRLWLALPIELALSSTWLPAGWELSAALLWPLQREDFAIDDLGTAYASPKLAAMITARGYLAWEW
jgi:hypothetical protein